ncbi:O-antigen ligase family protein [Luteibacter flocculans]|uniref:O-antigen ligase family protein n=1 Tax=Luteibacter flocculans TaxID=2780091 RepID=A0ABY4T7H6_9GAMM|nr:O-antigen ligase family protein [Luteibacter flocculans]URL60057.1 O-antigen ligase family protein [Luteibacter flocculans]
MFPLILLYVALTILRPQDYLPGMENVPVLPAVLALAFVAWLISNAKNFEAPQFVILPAFLLVLMASQVVNGWTGGAMDELARFGPVVAAFFVLASACHTQRRVTVAMGVFVACAAILALHGVEQARTGTGWTGIPLSEGGRIQYVGIFNDPNDLGLLFAATLPMAVFLGRRGAGAMRPVWLGAALLLLYGTYLTNSRGALLAVLLVAGCYLWYRKGIAIAGVLGVAGLAAMKLLSSRMSELDAGEESAAGRVDAWYSGLEMFRDHPALGVGAGNFTEYHELTAHNSFVLVLAETGFIGFVLWLAFVCYGFLMMLAIVRHERAPSGDAAMEAAWTTERQIALTLLLSQCGLFVAAFFLSRSYMVVLYLIAALVAGHYLGARRRWPELRMFRLSEGGWRWVPAGAGGVFVLFVLVAVLLRTT